MKNKRGKIPRILYLKFAYGDDFIDYIKDDYGIEKFLQEILDKEDSKTLFLKNDPNVREFSSHWFILTEYYKREFGKGIRDKDAINKLKSIRGFGNLEKIYEFRCDLFKADFVLNEKFKQKLSKNLTLLKKISTMLLKQKQKKNEFLIKSKMW